MKVKVNEKKIIESIQITLFEEDVERMQKIFNDVCVLTHDIPQLHSTKVLLAEMLSISRIDLTKK